MQCKLKFQRHFGKSVKLILKYKSGNSLVGQCLGFSASTAGESVQSLDGEPKILQAAWLGQKKKRKMVQKLKNSKVLEKTEAF